MAEKMNNLSGAEWLKHSFSIWRDLRKNPEELALKHPAMFPTQLAEKLIDIYTREAGEVVLDPFLGSGTTLVAAANRQRQGVGVELNPEYATIAESRAGEISPDYPPQILIGDAREKLAELDDESVDLSINSPPYWDILNQRRSVDDRDISGYSESGSDLGNTEDYQHFLSQLKQVYSEVYRVLKPNKRCVCVVMDIRKKSKFFPLHMDLSNTMTEIGFEVEEFIIWDRQHEYNNMKPLGYPWVFRVNKVHEFVCIYWKR